MDWCALVCVGDIEARVVRNAEIRNVEMISSSKSESGNAYSVYPYNPFRFCINWIPH